jgi:hypothetical protein
MNFPPRVCNEPYAMPSIVSIDCAAAHALVPDGQQSEPARMASATAAPNLRFSPFADFHQQAFRSTSRAIHPSRKQS